MENIRKGEILKAKDRWLAFEDDSPQKNLKREHKSYFLQIEEAVSLLWAERAIQDGITFTGDILQNKVKKLAELIYNINGN
ncbi:1148_t:CDS:2 [Paraglomus occultum]|uniref:1148_t:CDS:1 n=1 Tax=Paraglomus occultum TaxID=144539 RepID=A0A9N9FGX6_9GLOM|nr:1148_t:CDS:2 [Paraglomus occultum]